MGWCLLGLSVLLSGASQSAPAAKIIVHAGHLIADPGKPSLDNQSIIIENGKITAIVGGFVDGGRIVDLSQAWVMPGLIDMHTHVTVTMDIDSETPTSDFMPAFIGRPAARVLASEGRANSIMHNGFTTIRNLGDPASVTYDLRDAINAGVIDGPRIIASEPMFGVPVEYYLQAKASVTKAYKAHIPILFGTDLPITPIAREWEEFLALQDAGSAPPMCSRARRSMPSISLGMADTLGSIEAGKFADLIALAHDPRVDLHEMGKVIFVMKGGKTVRDDLHGDPS